MYRTYVAALGMASVCSVGLFSVSLADENETSKTSDASKKVERTDGEPSAASFASTVREDLFAGFEGDRKALDRGIQTCEEALTKNPRHAEALVWRGAARVYLSGEAFNGGDAVNGMKYWTTGIKDMDDAAEIAPNNIAVLIPRAAVLLPAGRSSPPAIGKPVLMKVRADFERTYERQNGMLDQLGEHPLGELRMGMADVYRLLGENDKSKQHLEAVVKELPDSDYADRAKDWLAAGPEKKLAHTCIGCHSD